MPAEPLRATGAFAKKVPQFQATRETENRRDPGTGVSDVTQLLTLTEETVMQNTKLLRRHRIQHHCLYVESHYQK